MKPIGRFVKTKFLALCVFLGACRPGAQVSSQWENQKEFEEELQALVESEQGPPGLVAVASRRGQVTYQLAVGHLADEEETPASLDASHQWWSVTKVVTAMAILQLVEEKKLSLDMAVADALGELPLKRHEDSDPPITIRQLLNHSSGLGDIGAKILGWIHFESEERPAQLELMTQALEDQKRLKASPGEQAKYSNLGYLILAVIIEKVSGKRYEEFVEERILAPLQMTRTGFTYSGSVGQREAIGTHPRDMMGWVAFQFFVDKSRAVRRSDSERHYLQRLYSDQLGATGLIGPASDLLRLGECLARRGELNGVRVLSERSVRFMEMPTLESGREAAVSGRALRFGAPWFIEESSQGNRLSHAGAGMGFVTFLQVRPETQTAVVVMANGTYLDGSWGEKIAGGAAMW